MKKTILQSFIGSVFLLILFFEGCSNDTITNTPVVTAKGIFVLYEGSFGQATSFDYGFIDPSNGSVQGNVYQNSNSGALMNSFPDGILISGNEIYITAQGTFAAQGTIYKINSTSNHLESSANFGKNPYSFVLDNNKFYVTNTSGDYISILDMNFNVLDSIPVGLNPADIISSSGKIYVTKQSYTTENSLAVIDESNNQVNKVFFNSPPISVASNLGNIYVSGYASKKIYVVNNAFPPVLTDSISVTIPEVAIGSIVAGDSHSLYVLGVQDTAFGYSTGKSVYKIDLTTKTVVPGFSIQFTGSNDAYGITYEPNENKIYIANSKGGLNNGEVRIYNSNGDSLKTYPDIGGKFPKKIAFKY